MAASRLAGLLALGALACGPSFQAVYECDVRFEHCYALDERAASPEAKRDCWHQWLRGYTYGQSRDRVEYANSRLSQLSLGPSMPAERSPDAPARRSPTVATPVPTNAFAPPPNLAASAPVVASSSPPPAMREAALRAPGADCSDGCNHNWSSCHETCKDRACDDCDRSYRACMPACFHDDAAPRQPPRSLR